MVRAALLENDLSEWLSRSFQLLPLDILLKSLGSVQQKCCLFIFTNIFTTHSHRCIVLMTFPLTEWEINDDLLIKNRIFINICKLIPRGPDVDYETRLNTGTFVNGSCQCELHKQEWKCLHTLTSSWVHEMNGGICHHIINFMPNFAIWALNSNICLQKTFMKVGYKSWL